MMSRVRHRSTHSHSFRSKEKGLSGLSTRLESEQNSISLRFDINTLLSLFNEMETSGSGVLERQRVLRIMTMIGLEKHVTTLDQEKYTFDGFLSVLGEIEVPLQPYLYVVSFVHILSNYRDKCLQSGDEGLPEASTVQERIEQI